MIRERVAENVYVFTSDLYAAVNAGAVVGPDFSVAIDTLPFPEETEQIRAFLEDELDRPVKYLIYTHYHADHTFGASVFDQARVLGSAQTRSLLDTVGRDGLRRAQEQNRDLRQVEIVLPELIFEGPMIGLRLGSRTLELLSLPGHSPDGVGVLVLEDRVLFSGDLMMPIPYVVDGDYDTMVENLRRLPKMKLESLVQGHGDVILRGEVGLAVKENISYLNCVAKHVRKAGRRKEPAQILFDLDVRECGKSRIMLTGLGQELHERNLEALFHQWHPEKSSLIK